MVAQEVMLEKHDAVWTSDRQRRHTRSILA